MYKLSPQDFTAIVAALHGLNFAGNVERRQFARMDVEAPVKAAAVTDGKVTGCYFALSQNISPASIGIFQRDRVKADDTFLICLHDGKEPLRIVCRAATNRLVAHDVHMVGAQFESFAELSLAAEFDRLAVGLSPK